MKTNYDKLSEDCIEVSKLQWKFSSLLRIVSRMKLELYNECMECVLYR